MSELIIKKEDLLHNINEIKSRVSSDDYTLIAVVKGNAYGLGIVEFTKFLIDAGFNFFAVAEASEALLLRKNGIKEKILLLTPYSDEKNVKLLVENDITLTIDSKESFCVADEICNKLNKKVLSHIKIDTGLSRYGFNFNNINEIKQIVKNSSNIIFEGIYSHFSCSLKEDSSFSNLQFNRFNTVIEKLKKENIEFKLRHICNSSGFFKYPNMHLNAARIGSAFSGNAVGIKTNLKRVGTFHTKISKIRNVSSGDYIGYANSYKVKKNMKIGVLPTGYYEGVGLSLIEQRYRFLSKAKKALIEFKNIFTDNSLVLGEFKVLGQIGMHDVVIDLTNKDYKENDDVYFYVKPVFIDTSVKRVYK
ncbi:MAG: alanine racemase [Bacilli bacterium]|nr:alanine racemase [Bacilli bacterium]